jgi:hypothetical protein
VTPSSTISVSRRAEGLTQGQSPRFVSNRAPAGWSMPVHVSDDQICCCLAGAGDTGMFIKGWV